MLIPPFHSVKSAKAAICTHADSRLWFYAVFYWSISENLIQFPFHGARLGKFQRIRLTDMVGGDAVILCKTQNVADGNAVDDLGRGKPISRRSHRPSGTGILPGHPCLLEQRGRTAGVCCMAGGTGSSCKQRKTGSSRWGTPCLYISCVDFCGVRPAGRTLF